MAGLQRQPDALPVFSLVPDVIAPQLGIVVGSIGPAPPTEIEPVGDRPRIPVAAAAEMPFLDVSRDVACRFQLLRDRRSIERQPRGVERFAAGVPRVERPGQPPAHHVQHAGMRRVLAGDVGRAGGRAGWRRRVGLHEPFAAGGQAIHVRRFVERFLAADRAVVTGRIHPAKVIGQDMNNVGFTGRSLGGAWLWCGLQSGRGQAEDGQQPGHE